MLLCCLLLPLEFGMSIFVNLDSFPRHKEKVWSYYTGVFSLE